MIYILIPTYNDSENFKSLFKNIKVSIKGLRYRIIIVDDGSTDNTRRIIQGLSKKFPVTFLGYKKNVGPGHAFKYGFDYLIPKLDNGDLVITMESDNTADYKIVRKLLEKTSRYDLVLASPLRSGGELKGMDLSRKLFSYVAGFADIVVFRVKGVRTYSSFFRVYRASILKKLKKTYGERFITEDGFTSVLEILIKISKLHARISEVPATIDWSVKKGKSKMNVIKTINRHFRVYMNYILGKYNL